ncbi:MAG: metalloregulator ArsR/SmtB family transcription factor [Caldilineaceae bacterium]
MALLNTAASGATAEEWLSATAARLSEKTLATNHLIFGELTDALTLPMTVTTPMPVTTFPTYLEALAKVSPTQLADRVGAGYATGKTAAVSPEVASLLAEPATMQSLIVDHLRLLWEQYFAEAWEKKSSMMVYIERELNSRTWPTTSANALLRAFLRKSVPEWLAGRLGGVEQIIFVPSPYLRFQAACFDDPQTLWILLWADFWVWPMRTEPIQRTEVLRAIRALDDETRLQILELLAAFKELRAQEIIAQLDIGQSTVSRHLKQLVNAGFLHEERAGDANKVYRLQHERIGAVTYSLSQLLSEENAQLVLTDVRLQQPAEIRPFLDRDGLVTTWPAKRKGQEAVLAYLITKFSIEERYTEAAVNALLNEWHTYDDPAYLRRSLIDMGLLKRTNDGAQYWREA